MRQRLSTRRRSASRLCVPRLAVALASAPVLAGGATEPTTFALADGSVGIGAYTMAPGMGGGVAVADYDGDGDLDVFVPTSEGMADQLYVNVTSGGGPPRFVERAAAVGLASLERGRNAVWFDADSDGRLDLLVAGDCFQVPCNAGVSMLRLYRQREDGQFTDVTVGSGLFEDGGVTSTHWHRGGTTVADLDLDGDPDVYTTSWRGGTRLYSNQGDGTFVEIGAANGAGSPPDLAFGHWQSVVHDFDGNGLPDIFVAVDFAEDTLLLQQSDGSFEDVAPAAQLDRPWNGMGVALGDVDNDGDFDLYVTNISDQFDDGPRHSTFYLNETVDGLPSFQEVSQLLGIDDVGWGWGVTFLDADNDGWLDLAATNGFPTHVDRSRFFFNEGAPLAFREAAAAVGIDDDEWGSGLVAFDVDRDGDLDLMQTCADGDLRLLVNELADADAHHLVVQPRRRGPSGVQTPALGAVIEVENDGSIWSRLITAGTSFMSQEPAEAFFGVGAATVVDRVTVRWPRGAETTLFDVVTDQLIVIDDGLHADDFESGDLAGWSSVVGLP